MKQLLKDYSGDIRIVYKNFVVHQSNAVEPALAGCAANFQGKFAAMESLLWKKSFAKRDYSRSHITKLARQAGLSMRGFNADRDGPCGDIIRREQEQMKVIGVTGTPAFFINGRFLSGAQPLHRFKTLIDEELAKANARIRRGEATERNYYEVFVERPGLKALATP